MTIEWEKYLPELQLLMGAALLAFMLTIAAPWITRLLVRLTTPFSPTQNLLDPIKPPMHLLIPLLGLQIFWNSAANSFLFIDNIRHLTWLAIIATTIWLVIRIISVGQQVILQRNPVNMSDNLSARSIQTQTKVLAQTLCFFVILFGVSAMLMTFPNAKQFGASLLASAGLAGLAVGFAAKPVLGNLIAGLQLAITQPIRLDDVVIVENEWGRIEEITGTYVVLRIWDDRRLIVPLQYFIENPFQNWTRRTSNLIGSLFLWVDYSMPLEPLRQELDNLCKQSPDLWDGKVSVLQVTDTTDKSIQLRILVSSKDSSSNWDLRCFVREKLINFISLNHPECLPQLRANLHEEAPKAAPVEQQISSAEHQPPV
ncbi:MAG TPA: mechanosensitive ion channel family protein [Cellvibrio sp.]|nr:mechanosensitive ion channel family protein [Cellvibrio sp.]